jgi:ABC-type transport system involved in cytochrome c biogenesis permease subunit
MNGVQSFLYWGAALLMAISFFSGLFSVFFKNKPFFTFGKITIVISFVLITIFGVARWLEWGHPPFVTLFESMITSVWFLILLYLIIVRVSVRLSLLLIPVSLFSFLLMGWSFSLPFEASPLSAALSNVWLFIHASFATSGAASFLLAASLSVLYLAGHKRIDKFQQTVSSIPNYDRLIGAINKMILFGLILWGVMIVSGSIWAHIAWGRYWAWDPIELWSIISWILYGLLNHARLAFKISNRLFAWSVILAALTVAFSLWGVQYIYDTIHTYG